jgi:hypothetical protein
MGLLKVILFRSFLSFLFICAGIVVVILGIVSWVSGWLAIKDFPLSTHGIFFIGGAFYIALGLLIAFIVLRKQKQ